MGHLVRLIKDSSIKYKLAGIILPSLLAIIFFSAQKITENYAAVKDMAVTEAYSTFAFNVNTLAHELQKERGITSFYIGSGGTKLMPEMEAQRRLSEKELEALNKKLDALHADELKKPTLAVKSMLGQLGGVRKASGELTLTVSQSVEYYSNLISSLIELSGTVPFLVNNVDVATHLTGFLVAQNYKESMGVERDILSGAFASNKLSTVMHHSLNDAIDAQDAGKRLYYTLMFDENIVPFDEFLKNDIVKKTDELRKLALAKGEVGNFGVDANQWYRLQTDKINMFNDSLIMGHLMKDIQKTIAEKSGEARSNLNATAILCAVILVMAIFISVYLTTGILRTVRQTTDVIGEIAQGDFTQKVHVEGSDEIGELGAAVNVHVKNMDDMLGAVNSLAIRVKTSATEIAAAVNEQASISTEQSASLTEITATMEEFSVSSSQIADSANSVAQLTKNMLEETDRSVVSLGSLKTKMDEIENDNKNSIHEILELDRKSKEIGKIMGLINNIADQTKMIAFNAAIEASSAGEAGKRFSVVAGEIRRLADNVMESTGEIQGKIDEIQKAVNRLVIVSEKGAKTVREGTDYATATLDDLVNIVAGTKSSTESAMQISFSTQQQKTASGQILTALKEIDQGLHHTSTAIHQTSSAAVVMGEIAGDLQKAISKFKGTSIK